MSNHSNNASESVVADGINAVPESDNKKQPLSDLTEDDKIDESATKKPCLDKKSKRGQNKVSQ